MDGVLNPPLKYGILFVLLWPPKNCVAAGRLEVVWRERRRKICNQNKNQSFFNFHLFFPTVFLAGQFLLSLSTVSPALLDRHDWAKAGVSLGVVRQGMKVEKEIGDKQEIPYYNPHTRLSHMDINWLLILEEKGFFSYEIK